MKTNKSPIIVAVDNISLPKALRLAKILAPYVWGFKLHTLIDVHGAGVLRKFKKYGNVFADLKIHDIPKTTALRAQILASAGASFISVHASGGSEMMRAAVSATRGTRAKILAITILTSHAKPARGGFLRLARDAQNSRVHGIVCSAHELEVFARDKALTKLIKVVPGIREKNDVVHDQKRTAAAKEALANGATYLVIGRSVTEAPNPLKKVKRILDTLDA